MEEKSWQAKLAKSNINITDVQFNQEHTTAVVCYEFSYHPIPGQTKWLKTADEFVSGFESVDKLNELTQNSALPPILIKDVPTLLMSEIANTLLLRVLELRKELEG